jgi:ABC-type transport system involved in cytochrome bd biosynthesis fused ATPase/permease subunit
MASQGILWDYMVGGKCINDPLMTPDKKEWMGCASKIAKYNLVSSIIAAVVIMTILIIVLSLLDAGTLYWFGAFALGALIIGSAVFSNMMATVSAETRWDATETKVRAQLSDVQDDKYFTNFETYDESKKKAVKEKWLDGAKKIREIEAEQRRLDAQDRAARGMENMGQGQRMQGYAAVGNTVGQFANMFNTHTK